MVALPTPVAMLLRMDLGWVGLLATGAAGAALVRFYDIRADRARARRQFIAALRIVRDECAENASAINLAQAADRQTRLTNSGYRQVATILMQPAEPAGPWADLRRFIGGSVPELDSTLREHLQGAYRDIYLAVSSQAMPSPENLLAGADQTETLLHAVSTEIDQALKKLGAT